MKNIRLFAAILTAAVLFTGCGGRRESYMEAPAAGGSANMKTQASYAPDFGSYEAASMAMEEMAYDDGAASSVMSLEDANISSGKEDYSTLDKKLIRNVSLDMETTEFDALTANIRNKISEAGGYVENSNTSNYGDMRNAWITARIPQAKLDMFLDTAINGAKITNRNDSTEDVTLTYSDLDTRVKTLKAEQDRLLELMAQADNIEAVIALEDRLSEISYQIENISSRLKLYDNQVNYSTVYMSIQEVNVVTAVKRDTFGDKVVKGLQRNVLNLIDGIGELLLWFITSIPTLIVLGIVVFVIVKIVKAVRKNAGARREKKRIAKAQKAAANKPVESEAPSVQDPSQDKPQA